MATPHYSYEKRQKELAKKRKKEDKLKQKSQRKSSDAEPGSEDADEAEIYIAPTEQAPKPRR